MEQNSCKQKELKYCSSCCAAWSDGMWGINCKECGGFPLKRPCCICNGKCGSVWTRNIGMSHSNKCPFWDGKCLLPSEQQHFFLVKNVVEMDPDELASALEDL